MQYYLADPGIGFIQIRCDEYGWTNNARPKRELNGSGMGSVKQIKLVTTISFCKAMFDRRLSMISVQTTV